MKVDDVFCKNLVIDNMMQLTARVQNVAQGRRICSSRMTTDIRESDLAFFKDPLKFISLDEHTSILTKTLSIYANPTAGVLQR